MRLLFLFLLFNSFNTLNGQRPFKNIELMPPGKAPVSGNLLPMNRIFGSGSGALQTSATTSIVPLKFEKSPSATKGKSAYDLTPDPFSFWAEGNQKLRLNQRAANSSVQSFMGQFKALLKIDQIEEEFIYQSVSTDDIQMQHIRVQQVYRDLLVYGGELIIHNSRETMTRVNGRVFPTPSGLQVKPELSTTTAVAIIVDDLIKMNQFSPVSTSLLGLYNRPLYTSELLIYHDENNRPHLAYFISYVANGLDIWNYMVDAHNGIVLNKYKNTCTFLAHEHENTVCRTRSNGDYAAVPISVSSSYDFTQTIVTATDLYGSMVSLNVFEAPDGLSLVDGSRAMFKSIGTETIQPVGVIWTFDGFNTSPENISFNPGLIKGTPAQPWISRTAASGHLNAGLAYDYFRTKHNRNSINGEGGNILSIINIAASDGTALDNAFWNGAAMFYGNGKDVFTDLAKALDVAGHELSHGVIQSTANLEYQGESGALNESFADIFGRLIDRDDWLIGEDVVKTSFFPSGALRSFIDPHNGGSKLGDAGYQPRIYTERYLGVLDNAGVHINSGIVNWAFYQFVTRINHDLDKAEKIYYRALTVYLTRSSKFIDCRKAVIQSATDLYGAGSSEVTAARAAYDAVGILEGTSTITQTDLNFNTGSDFIVHTNRDETALLLSDGNGKLVEGPFNPLYFSPPLSKASVTDDGSGIIFVGKDKRLHYVVVDWIQGLVKEEGVLQDEPIWRNVAISRDGKRIAAVKAILENKIYVFDFTVGLGGQWRVFDLYNPTFTEGVQTNNVNFADVIEFNHTGELLMYDAENQILNSRGAPVVYWNICFIRVHDHEHNSWGDGKISKLIGQLPENTSIGNPTFAKNSPYIIAFDMLISSNNDSTYLLLGGNLETGKIDTIFVNTQQNIPSYSNKDDKIIFDATTSGGIPVVAQIRLDSSKIKSTGVPEVLINNARSGTWFANGKRNTSTATKPDLLKTYDVKLSPNPVIGGDIKLSWVQPNTVTKNQISIYDVVGRLHWQISASFQPGDQTVIIPVDQLPAGIYILQLNIKGMTGGFKFVRL